MSSYLLSIPYNLYILLSGLRRPSLFLIRRYSFLESLAFRPEDPSQELVAHVSPCRSLYLLSYFVTLFYSSSSLLSARFYSCIIVSCRNRIDFRSRLVQAAYNGCRGEPLRDKRYRDSTLLLL